MRWISPKSALEGRTGDSDYGDNHDQFLQAHEDVQERVYESHLEVCFSMLEEAGEDPAEVLKIYPKKFADAVDGSGVDLSMVIEYEKSTFYRRDE